MNTIFLVLISILLVFLFLVYSFFFRIPKNSLLVDSQEYEDTKEANFNLNEENARLKKINLSAQCNAEALYVKINEERIQHNKLREHATKLQDKINYLEKSTSFYSQVNSQLKALNAFLENKVTVRESGEVVVENA